MERNQLKTSLATTQSIISKLNLSFDPLSRSETVTRSEDILQQAESLNRTCQALCDRLVGNVLLTIVWIRINLAPGSGSKCHNFNFNVKNLVFSKLTLLVSTKQLDIIKTYLIIGG